MNLGGYLDGVVKKGKTWLNSTTAKGREKIKELTKWIRKF